MEFTAEKREDPLGGEKSCEGVLYEGVSKEGRSLTPIENQEDGMRVGLFSNINHPAARCCSRLSPSRIHARKSVV